jgi:hypothetical protein
MALGCGSGDKGGIDRVTTTEMVTHTEDAGAGPGGGTGACVWEIMGQVACYSGLPEAACNSSLTGGYGTLTYTAGTSCESLGYLHCQTQGGYTVCQ